VEAQGQMNRAGLARGIGVGVVGSLVGTAAMDLVIIVEFAMVGLPVLTYLDLIGSVFRSGIPIGTLVHILIGAFLGLIFVVPVLAVDVLRIETVKKGLVLGFLLGLASIVACVPFALLVDLPIAQVLSFMAVPHLVWGSVFGAVVGYGLRPATATRDQ
jgi:hypothetical protein